MTTIRTLQKWGNSNGIRLPKDLLEAINLKPDQKIMLTIQGESLILTPIRPEPSLLDELLADATPENVKSEFDWGDAVGAEIYE